MSALKHSLAQIKGRKKPVALHKEHVQYAKEFRVDRGKKRTTKAVGLSEPYRKCCCWPESSAHEMLTT